MTKTLCDLKKLRKKDPGAYFQLVDKPTHGCKRCGRVANSKRLCKPAKLKD